MDKVSLINQQLESQVIDKSNCCKFIDFSIPGHPDKVFKCFAKISTCKKYWTLVYINPYNTKDVWVRLETVSSLLWYYGKHMEETDFITQYTNALNYIANVK